MKQRTTPRVLALGLALIGTTTSLATYAQHRPHRTSRAPSSQCVQFSRADADDGRSITFQLGNECPIAVEATVSWHLVCGSSSQAGPIERHESMTPGARRVITASTEACGDRDFRIEAVRWSWRRSAETETP